MTNPSGQKRASGFSLLEVLVAVVILSVGLLALASLQVSLIRSGSDAKARTTAMAIAVDQLERLRAFADLNAYTALTTDTSLAAVVAGGVSFTPTVTVSRYVYDTTANAGAGGFIQVNNTATDAQIASTSCASTDGTNGHACISGRDFKRAAVVVTWTDSTGASPTVAIEDAFSGDNPGESANVARTTKSIAPRKISIRIYNPGATDGVIPIAISSNSNTAATNPTPEVAGRNTSSAHVVETRFDVFTYGAVNGNTATATSRVETVVAGCQCDAVTQTTTRGYRPTYWDGEKYTTPDAVTSYYAPGQVATTNLPATQSARCTICCRDHHDPVNVAGAKFSPRRGTHTHYGIDGVVESTVFSATGVPTTSVAAESAPLGTPVPSQAGAIRYLEACRIIRVDGIFRVAADAFNDHTDLIQTNDSGTSPNLITQGSPTLPAATSTATPASTYNYAATSGFVLSYMTARFVTPANNASQGTYNTLPTLNPTAGSLHPTSIAMNKADIVNRWTHLRGLYIDYLEPVAVTKINAVKAECDAAEAALTGSCDPATTKKERVYALLPFTSINITEVANWRAVRQTVSGGNGSNDYVVGTPYIDDTSYDHIYVANNDFITSITDTNPVRGATTPGYTVPYLTRGATGTQLSVSPTLSGEIYSGNSGLALLLDPVNPDETVRQDVQPFTMNAGNPGASSGSFQVVFPLTQGSGQSQTTLYTFSLSSAGYPKITSPSPSIRCSFSTKNGGNPKKPNPFTCVSRSIGTGLAMSVSNYNYQTTEAVASGSLTCANTDGSGTTATYSGPYTRTVCKNYQMGTVASNPTRVISSNPPTTLSGTLLNEGLITETGILNIASPGVASGDTYTIPLAPQSPTYVLPTCKYTVVGGSNTFDIAQNGCP
jgi:type IV pilus modification protein PilV